MWIPYFIDDDVELRLLEAQYARPLFQLVERDREYLRRWQNWPDKIRTLQDMRRLIHYSIQKRKQNSGMDFVVFHHGDPVGKIGLVYINWYEEQTEIGYWLAQDRQGQGIITRSARALTGYALGRLKLGRVQIRCADGNMRSRAIPERLGFAFEGTRPGATRLRSQFVDEVAYTMTARRWYRRMIYHITTRLEWNIAKRRGEYAAPSLKTQGFIHFSGLSQVVKVADAIYPGHKDLVLLCVDPERLRAPLQYEPPNMGAPVTSANGGQAHAEDEGELFPHVYGALDLDSVIRVFDFPENGAGQFALPLGLPR